MLNDGTGHFSSYWSLEDQALTNMLPTLIDMDNDGDLDAIVTYRLRAAVHPAKIFFNDGLGRFTDSGQVLGSFLAGRAAFGDLNSDGYPDLLLTSFEKAGEIWLNDGTGHFKDTSYRLQGQGAFHSPSMKDLDNDGDLDIVIANYFGGRNEIWFNESK